MYNAAFPSFAGRQFEKQMWSGSGDHGPIQQLSAIKAENDDEEDEHSD